MKMFEAFFRRVSGEPALQAVAKDDPHEVGQERAEVRLSNKVLAESVRREDRGDDQNHFFAATVGVVANAAADRFLFRDVAVLLENLKRAKS